LNTTILAEPALVGRQRENRELKQCLDAAVEGKGNTVFISGEAGSGKTRLAKEFLNQAKSEGVKVLSGWCLSNAAVPYFPFLEASNSSVSDKLSSLFTLQGLNTKTWLTQQSRNQNLSPRVWKDQTFAAVTQELLSISTANPLILFIDDLHWADSASLSLLHYLSRSILCDRILIIATYRSEEVESNQTHQLRDTLRLMRREDLFKEITLSSLNQAEVEEIAENMLGGKVEPEFVRKLTQETKGLPLFVIESIRTLYTHRSFIQENHVWHTKVKSCGIPPKVKDVILRRLDFLEPNQRKIMDAASLIGEKFDPILVAQVLHQDSLEVLQSLNTMVKSTFLVYAEENCYKFEHPKIREVISGEISEPLKRMYHLKIAENLEKLSKHRLPVNELAYHYAQAGDQRKSIKYSLEAGRDALTRFSNAEALNHFSYVLQIIADDPKYAEERMETLEGTGEALFAQSLFREAKETFEKLSDISSGQTKIRALRRAMDSSFFQGDFIHLYELTKKDEEFININRLERARILMNRARAATFLGNVPAGKNDFEAALSIFEEECCLSDIARVLLGLGGISHQSWTLLNGIGNILRSIALFEELGDDRGLMDAYNRAGQNFYTRILWTEALDSFEKAIQIGDRIEDFNRVAEAYASSAWVYESMGNLHEALSRSVKALEYSTKAQSQWIRGITFSNLTRIYARLGDFENAEKYFGKLKELPPQIIGNIFVNFRGTEIVLHASRNKWQETNRCIEDILEKPGQTLSPSAEMVMRQLYLMGLKKQERNDEAYAQEEKVTKLKEKLKIFQHPVIIPTLLIPKQVRAGEDFVVRLDLINPSAKSAVVLSVEGLIPQNFRVLAVPNYCSAKEDSVMLNAKTVDPFHVLTLKIALQGVKCGVFRFSPQILSLDERHRTKRYSPRSVLVNVQPKECDVEQEGIHEVLQLKFGTVISRQVFDYLMDSFINDFVKQKIPQPWCGWRTLMDIVKQAKVTKHSIYGASGGRGRAVAELERLGLVEARFFQGERGRGGRILKLRVSTENQTVKNQIRYLIR
jgi:tetratricopeptide (TPR) repeat protein